MEGRKKGREERGRKGEREETREGRKTVKIKGK